MTFNIADYRPLFRVRSHDRTTARRESNGLIVFSSNSGPAEYDRAWPRPAVVEIASVREAHRPAPRRGKILRFSNPASHRVYVMPTQQAAGYQDDDPGPLVA